jgi:hypothetical protein
MRMLQLHSGHRATRSLRVLRTAPRPPQALSPFRRRKRAGHHFDRFMDPEVVVRLVRKPELTAVAAEARGRLMRWRLASSTLDREGHAQRGHSLRRSIGRVPFYPIPIGPILTLAFGLNAMQTSEPTRGGPAVPWHHLGRIPGDIRP